jgi:hypothetical protein
VHLTLERAVIATVKRRVYAMRYDLIRLGLCVLSLGLLLPGCGDDGGPTPVTGVSISPESVTLEIAEEQVFTATVSGGDSKNVDWYVNGIPGGNSEVGTIVAAGPATYTAPEDVPDPAIVVVKAVSRENSSMMDSCLVTVQFTKIHVNASTGDDGTGTGSIAKPLKSITAGLQIAEAEMTVLAAAGLYDAANGEVFPFELLDGVSLVGENWENTTIRGHSEVVTYFLSIEISGDGCSLRNFTLEEGPVVEEGWNLALYINRTEDAVVESIRVSERAGYGVFRISYTMNTRIENCRLEIDDGQRNSNGIEFNTNAGNTIIRNCTFRGFYLGIALNNFANPLIEGCAIEGNRIGVNLCCASHVDHNPNPDLGGGTRGSVGGNFIRDNTDYGILNGSTNTIYAKFNTWGNDPPVEDEDFRNTDTGSVVWE